MVAHRRVRVDNCSAHRNGSARFCHSDSPLFGKKLQGPTYDVRGAARGRLPLRCPPSGHDTASLFPPCFDAVSPLFAPARGKTPRAPRTDRESDRARLDAMLGACTCTTAPSKQAANGVETGVKQPGKNGANRVTPCAAPHYSGPSPLGRPSCPRPSSPVFSHGLLDSTSFEL